MIQVILLDNNQRDCGFLAIDWEASFDVDIISCASEVDTIRQLERLSQKKRILIIKNMGSDFTHIKQYFEGAPDTVLIIQKNISNSLDHITSNFTSIYEVNNFFEKDKIKEIFTTIGIKKNGDEDTGYCKIQLYNFFQFNFASVNIHLKLSQRKFVKIINEGELFTKDILEKYHKKNIKYLYIKREDLLPFMEEVTKTLLDFYNKNDLSDNVKKEVQLASLDNINESLKSIGLTESTIKLANETISSVMSSFKGTNRLWDYLQNKSKNTTFFSEHSLAVAVLSSAIAEGLEWRTEYTIRKLVMASLLHDIGLENEHLIYLNDTKEKGFEELTSLEKKEYLEHPQKGCLILKDFPELPANVDTIIMEHHEGPSGNGFPRKLNSFNITPLSCVFIIAEKFYHLLHKGNYTIDARNDALKILGETYSQGNFKSPLNSLVNLFLKGEK
jgi:HD-GYP domain-containing protein (c-di-GMP phosphodiesterase class II)